MEDDKAREAALAPDGAGLVRQNEKERFLAKIQGFKVHNLNGREKVELDEKEVAFVMLLVQLSWYVLGLNRERLEKLDENEVRILAEVLYERVRSRARLQLAFGLLMPVIGWIALLTDWSEFRSLGYRCLWRMLRKTYGPDYSPRQCLQSCLEKNRTESDYFWFQ